MRKKGIGILIATVVVVGLTGLLLFLRNTPKPGGVPAPSAPAATYVLWKENAYAQKVTVVNEAGTFTVLGRDSGGVAAFSLEGLEGYGVTGALAGLGRGSAQMAASMVVAESGSLAPFGLESPAAVAQIEYSDGTTAALYVGEPAAGGEGYYVSAGGTRAYLVSSSTIAPFLNGAFDFLARAVTPGTPEEASIQMAELGGSMRPLPIRVQATPKGSDANLLTPLAMTEPVRANVDSQYGLEKLASAYGITADAIVAAEPGQAQLKAYGLLEPYSTLRIEDENLGTIALSASAPDDNGTVYLMREGLNLVYRVKAASLGWLEAQAFDLMSKLAVVPFLSDISQVVVATPTENHVFSLSGAENALSVSYRGKTLNTEAFRKYYQLLITARFESMAELPVVHAGDVSASPQTAMEEWIPPGSEPLLTITYHYLHGVKTDEVSFFDGPPRKAYIVVNGGTPYLTPDAYIHQVLAGMEALLGS